MSNTYRTWLSSATSDSNHSYVMAVIEEGRGKYDDHCLTLADCHKQVSVYFPAGKAQRKAAIAKLGKLQKAMDLIWEALEEDEQD